MYNLCVSLCLDPHTTMTFHRLKNRTNSDRESFSRRYTGPIVSFYTQELVAELLPNSFETAIYHIRNFNKSYCMSLIVIIIE